MKNPGTELIFSVLLLFLILSNAVSAMGPYTCGVKAGDWVRYDLTISSGAYTVTGWVKITIQSVQGTHVTGTYEANVPEYSVTDQPEQFSIDLSTAGSAYSSYVIPANLSLGDYVPGEHANVSRLADWNGRKAVLATATSPFIAFVTQIYWDQATGVLLESSGSAVGTTFSIALAETSLWSSGFLGFGWWLWAVIAAGVIVIVAGVVLTLRRKKPLTTPPLAETALSPPP